MTIVSLIFLFVYLFGAYTYGASTVLSIRQIGPVWGGSPRDYTPDIRKRIDKANLGLFVVSTIWFVLLLLIEFRDFISPTRESWLDLGTLIVFLFPPVIMHTVCLESHGADDTPPPRVFRQLLIAMYVLSPALGLYVVAAIFEKVPHPQPAHDLAAVCGPCLDL